MTSVCPNRPGRDHEWYRRSDGRAICRDCGYGCDDMGMDTRYKADLRLAAEGDTLRRIQEQVRDNAQCWLERAERAEAERDRWKKFHDMSQETLGRCGQERHAALERAEQAEAEVERLLELNATVTGRNELLQAKVKEERRAAEKLAAHVLRLEAEVERLRELHELAQCTATMIRDDYRGERALADRLAEALQKALEDWDLWYAGYDAALAAWEDARREG